MDEQWVNTRTERKPKMLHVHADGSRHETEETIPMLVPDGNPPYHRSYHVCNDCHERREHRVIA